MYRIEIIELVADISNLKCPFLFSRIKRFFAYSIMKQGGTTIYIVPGKGRNAFTRDFLYDRKVSTFLSYKRLREGCTPRGEEFNRKRHRSGAKESGERTLYIQKGAQHETYFKSIQTNRKHCK